LSSQLPLQEQPTCLEGDGAEQQEQQEELGRESS